MPSGIAKLLLATAIVCGSVALAGRHGAWAADAETTEPSKGAADEYATVKESRDFRVTLLGVTKGISFLRSSEPAADDGRAPGSHPVRWLRVAALVEALGEKKNPGVSLTAETPDGAELVDKMPVELNGRVTTMRAGGTAEMDLNFHQLDAAIFPVALPNREAVQDAKVFIYTLSGDVRASDTATLRFRCGPTEDQQEAVFEGVPLP